MMDTNRVEAIRCDLERISSDEYKGNECVFDAGVVSFLVAQHDAQAAEIARLREGFKMLAVTLDLNAKLAHVMLKDDAGAAQAQD